VGARPTPFAPPPPLWRHHQPRRDVRPGAVTAPACAALAERGFGQEALKLIFLFSDFIQILTNLKICVGFI
jgi:hypothetical protein